MPPETRASSYVRAATGVPLGLRAKISYPASTDDPTERVLDEFDVDNIIENEAITHRLGGRGGTFKYLRPLRFSLTPLRGSSSNALFRGLTVTFRFRRVSPTETHSD